MKNSLFHKKLSLWQIPEAAESVADRAEWHALTAYRMARKSDDAPPESETAQFVFSFRRAWPVVPLLLVLAFIWWFVLPEASTDVAADNHVFQEMEVLFPGRVVAVVQRDQKIDLQLGERCFLRPADQRVEVMLSMHDETVKILTYSGASVCVNIAGGSICVTPLITGSGEVILVGESGLVNQQSGIHAIARTIHRT